MITLEIPAPEFVKRFQAGEIPSSAHVTVSFEGEEALPLAPAPLDPALALIESWLAQAPTDALSIEAAEADLREVQGALNATRQEAGARLLYPPKTSHSQNP